MRPAEREQWILNWTSGVQGGLCHAGFPRWVYSYSLPDEEF